MDRLISHMPLNTRACLGRHALRLSDFNDMQRSTEEIMGGWFIYWMVGLKNRDEIVGGYIGQSTDSSTFAYRLIGYELALRYYDRGFWNCKLEAPHLAALAHAHRILVRPVLVVPDALQTAKADLVSPQRDLDLAEGFFSVLLKTLSMHDVDGIEASGTYASQPIHLDIARTTLFAFETD